MGWSLVIGGRTGTSPTEWTCTNTTTNPNPDDCQWSPFWVRRSSIVPPARLLLALARALLSPLLHFRTQPVHAPRQPHTHTHTHINHPLLRTSKRTRATSGWRRFRGYQPTSGCTGTKEPSLRFGARRLPRSKRPRLSLTRACRHGRSSLLISRRVFPHSRHLRRLWASSAHSLHHQRETTGTP